MSTEKAEPNVMDRGVEVTAIHHEALPRKSAESLRSFTAEAVGGDSVEDLPPNYYKNWKFIGTMIAFAAGYNTSYFSYIMPVFALAFIEKDTGASEDAVWVVLAWILGQSIIFTIVGRLSDLFGRRYFYIGGSATALVGLIVCGSAHKLNTIIGGTILTGLGTGTQISSAIVGGELLPNRHRFFAFGVFSFLFFPLAMIVPAVSTIAAERSTWRWAYFTPAILCFINLLLLIFCYFPPTFHQLHTSHSKMQTLKSLDFGGLVLWTGALSSLLLGFSWGGQRYAWHSYQVITTIAVGAAGMIVFVLYELFSGVKHPLMPARVVRATNYASLVLISSAGTMTIFGCAIIWSQQPTVLWGVTPGQANWLNPIACIGLAGSFAAGFIGHFRHQKWILVGTCLVFTAFVGGMAGVTYKTKAMGIAFMTIFQFLAGAMEALTFVAAPLMGEQSDVGLANGVQFSIRSCLGAIATSIFVTVLKNKIVSNMQKYVIPAALSHGLPQTSLPGLFAAIQSGTASALEAVPGMDVQIAQAVGIAIKISYEKTFSVIYLIAMAFGICATIAAFLLRGSALDNKLTTQVARKLQGIGRQE